MGPLLAAAAAAAARTRARRGAVSPASSSVTPAPHMHRTCTPHLPRRKHVRRTPSAGEIADPRGGIVCLSPAPRHLGEEVLEGGGACHAHRVARRALHGIHTATTFVSFCFVRKKKGSHDASQSVSVAVPPHRMYAGPPVFCVSNYNHWL